MWLLDTVKTDGHTSPLAGEGLRQCLGPAVFSWKPCLLSRPSTHESDVTDLEIDL